MRNFRWAPLLRMLLTLAMSAGAAEAETTPHAVKADDRIRTVAFEKDNVVFLAGTMGVSTMIVFDDEETIATVAMGDSMSWQAVPDQSKHYLFIKPLERDAVTNMNVVTTKRIYNFVLRAGRPGAPGAVYKLRFVYPDKEEDARLLAKATQIAAMPNLSALKKHPELANFDYGFKGSVLNKPDNVFDDGTKTYFRFSGDVPAIFLVMPGLAETLVNYRREGDVIVVDKLAAQWTLRSGDEATCVFNLRARKAPSPARDMTLVEGEPVAEANGAQAGWTNAGR
jgi:type IV secretion system protein VirB9